VLYQLSYVGEPFTVAGLRRIARPSGGVRQAFASSSAATLLPGHTVDWFSIPLRVFTWPPQKFNRWSKKRGADRLGLMREGSEVLTPAIELAKQVGPTGIMWGTDEEVQERMRGWAEESVEHRAKLLAYANGHPADDVRELANEFVGAIGTSFSATYYLFVTRNTAQGGDGMKSFENATQRQEEAVALGERLLKKIRSY
jgi:hypothetical protein